jgi:ATP-dependent RNA helicase DDX3X
LFSLLISFARNNNRRYNNFNQRDNFQPRGGGSDFNNFNNHSNYNNNRYQNGESADRGGNWSNRGGPRTFNNRSGGDSRYQQQQQQQQQGPPPPLDEQALQQPPPPQGFPDEPVNTRWQEPPPQQRMPQQDDRYGRPPPNNGGGFGGKWSQRGGDVDYTVPLPRDERVELELFGTANTGINFSKYEDIPVEATGQQVPEHITTFDDIKLTEIIRSNIKLARYDKPTPVQKYAIPIILGGRDLMSCAQTGSG